MKKKTTISIVAAVVIVVLGGLVTWVLISQNRATDQQQTAKSTNSQSFVSEYPKVGADNRFVYATTDQVLEVFESGSGLVFLGFPECPWCQQLAPIVDESARLEGLEKIYYLNILESRQNNDQVYQKLVDRLKDYLAVDDDGNPRITVPDVTALRDGQIVGRFKQESADSQVTPETYWTDERRERAVVQLREMISKTANETGDSQ